MPTPPHSRRATRGGTADQVLDVAERLLQERGYNGFSYADAAAQLGITKAALHYHFAGKAELGKALIDRYAGRFAEALAAIDASGADAAAKLAAYAELYASVLRDGRMCLCGMLAAEYHTLPAPMREAVTRFFDDNETWLTEVIESGARAGELRISGSAHDAARLLVGGLEGAMLVARLRGDPARFDASAERLLAAMA
jgi:TetR/AcrR family transcriptional regulator, transcriptional repressor for nem operon